MFLKCHAPICLVVGVSPLCSMMQQMVRKLHVQQCSIDCRWFGDDWGKIGRGHKFSIVYAELADSRVYTLFSIAQAFSHTHEVSSAALHGRLASTLYREQAMPRHMQWTGDRRVAHTIIITEGRVK